MGSSFQKNSCCANDDTIPNNPKSTFFGHDEKSESTLSRSIFLNVDNVDDVNNVDKVDNVDSVDRQHSL